MIDVIENKIEKSGLITLDLGDYYPKGAIISFDIRDFLYEGMILREKEFRANLKSHDWDKYSNCFVHISKADDLIIPSWAYMLIGSYLAESSKDFCYGEKNDLIDYLIIKNLRQNIDANDYSDKRVLVKGCSTFEIPQSAYIEIFKLLKPATKSLMFGEACSSVPVYKRPN